MLKKPAFFVVCAALAITNLSVTMAQTGPEANVSSFGSALQTNQYAQFSPAIKSTLKVQPASASGTTFSQPSSYVTAAVSTTSAALAPAPSIPPQPVVEQAPAVEQAPVVEYTPVVEHAPVVEHVPAVTHAPAISYAPAMTYAPAARATPICTSGG